VELLKFLALVQFAVILSDMTSRLLFISKAVHSRQGKLM